MPVADSRYFSREHIETHMFNASPRLAEQAIHCLELVAELVSAGLEFQFKGGNSLLLILDTPHRFSIDVDIATGESRERIDECLRAIIDAYGVFTRWDKRKHKTKPWLPIASYYLFYRSCYPSDEEPFVMLDVQLRNSPYRTKPRPVRFGEIFQSNVSVTLPLAASIVGDKLLTVGPSTLGIPLGKNKEAQRLKHVFDISSLLDTTPCLDDIRDSFSACLMHENDLQEKTLSSRAVMDDTVSFCASVAFHGDRPASDDKLSPVLKENTAGFGEFTGFLFEKGYTWKRLQCDMARVALTISAVCLEEVTGDQFQRALTQSSGAESHRLMPESLLADNLPARRYWECINTWFGRCLLDP